MARRPQLPGQPSLFGVVATDPSPDDLAGLLAGPGRLRRMGGTAQVNVRVDAAWRVHALVAELALRDLPGGWESTGAPGRGVVGGKGAGESYYVVRTAFTTHLVALADRWSAGPGEAKGPPPGLHLNGQALRLWVAAAGTASPDGYLLRLGAGDEASWPAVGAALSAAGLAAALLVSGVPEAGGPAYRITGRRRLARLAELVGDPPPTAPAGAWPALPGRS
jgi:hypothetical protein